jgi:ComF family protein
MPFRHLLAELGELLLPSACAGCGGAPGRDALLCPACRQLWPRIPAGHCTLCQQAPAAPGRERCPGCAPARGPLAACVAAAPLAGPVLDAVHRFKYPAAGLAGLDPAPTALLRALVREAAARAPGPEPGRVVPVPLHPRRLRSRGFNPAAELARALARGRGLVLDATALRRRRDTPSQTGLDRRGRRRNVRGAFRARRGFAAPACVWLVDDVVTTGATLAEAARALRRAGARHVVGVCAARTPFSTSGPSRSGPRAAGRDPPAS